MEEVLDEAINNEEQLLDVAQSGQQSFTVNPVETSVIKRAMKGEEKAFEQVFMGTYRYVLATVRKYLKNEQDAYDAIQDTYTKVYKGFSRLQSADSFYPWLHRIAENCAKDILKFSESNLSVSPDETAEDIATEDQSARADVVADVGEVLKLLPKEQSELLVRVYYDKMRVSEIAHMQHLPVTTVHNRLKAAKKKLKELLSIRGIDKPVYSGEFVAMISTALRDAIGTQLLSMAVAEEILHNVTGSNNKQGAFVVSAFARKMRNNAVKNIAAMLLLTCCLIVAFAALIARIMTKGSYGGENGTSAATSHTTQAGGAVITSQTATSISTATHNTASTQTEKTRSTVATSATTPTTKPEQPKTLIGSLEISENFGTFAEDGYLGIATTKDRIYAVESSGLAIRSTNTPIVVESANRMFDELYGESGCFLNVFENDVYWINQNSRSQFVLNRCNLDGSAHYTKVFEEFDCTFLTNMLVADDGVYFLAGIHGQHEYTNSATLYRTDYDFNVQDTLANVADYTLVKDTIYYLYGNGNRGVLFRADRDTFENRTNISSDQLSYGSIHSTGDILVLGEYNKYGHSEFSSSFNLAVIDSVTGETVRMLCGEAGERFEVKDVSPFNGGTVMYNHNGVLKKLNITTGSIENMRVPCGTVHGEYKYLVDEGTLQACEVDSDVYQSWH